MSTPRTRSEAEPLTVEQAAAGFAAAGSEARLAVLSALVRAGPQGLSVGEILSQSRGNIQIRIPQRLRSLVNAGHLGRKTGQGFYFYAKGKPIKDKPPKH